MPISAKDLTVGVGLLESDKLRRQVESEKRRSTALLHALEDAGKLLDSRYVPIPVKVRKGKAAKHITRVIVADSHGAHIDPAARDAFLRDLANLDIHEMVWLGDHLDCGGTFSVHQRNYTHEMTESYAEDVAATNDFIDRVQKITPNAVHYYLQGNHENHIERWAARNFEHVDDAKMAAACLGCEATLHLSSRGFRYRSQSEYYDGLSIPGTIRLGKVHFTHGFSAAKHAASTTLARTGDNVVFGHVHRIQEVIERTVARTAFGAWCVGTLAKLQPLYRHTTPTSWSHGYGIEFVNQSTGTFAHWNVPLIEGESLLLNAINSVKGTSK
jgi:UDP-2,3-diacylglucosamine pyrophosphatase LpxH